MRSVAALFPGQGSQTVGMGRDLVERWPVSAGVFEMIDSGLSTPLSELCWNGPEDDLRLTENTQPALLAHSIAAWEVLSAAGLEVGAVAGHSLGEYSAVVAAGGLGLADAARTVGLRGRLMQEAVPVGEGAMAAVIGLDDDVVEAVCSDEEIAGGGPVAAVNFNSPGQVVIAGAAAVSLPDEVRDGLIRQVDAPVLWSETIRRMRADGFDTFVEVGTGNFLSGLVRRIDRDAVCYQAGTVETVEKVIAELVG